MSDDLFRRLKEVGAREAAERADDEAWRRRAAGEDGAELEARAASDEEAAHMRAATAPRDDAFLDAMTAKALAAARPAASRAPVRRIGRAWPLLAAPLAAAAAIALWMSGGSRHGAPLPAYALAVEGPDRAVRHGPAEPPTDERRALSDGARLSIVMRPQTRPAAPVEAWAWVEGAGPRRAAGVAPRVEPSGAVVLEGSDRDVFGDARGDLDLVLGVAPTGTLDGSLDAAVKAQERGEARVARVRVRR